ncbi:MAG: hypothetical protein WCK76_06250 [Elusimicrobiota bacterium]
MDKIKKFTRSVFLAVQRVLVPAFLFLAYIFAIGAMAALDKVFRFQPRRKTAAGSYWQPGESVFSAYCGGKDAEDALSQS